MNYKINNESGAILLLTLLFVLAFTALGIASIYFAGQQNDFTEKLKFSTQALWLADAGIERAKQKPAPFGPETDLALGSGTYDIQTIACPSPVDPQLPSCICNGAPCVRRWQVNTRGLVNNEPRSIRAVISKFRADAITATGAINASCVPDGSAEINGNCVQDPQMTLLEYFGLTYTNDHENPANITLSSSSTNYAINHSYDGSNYGGAVYDGITVITSSSRVDNNPGNAIISSPTNPAFLIIDCRCPASQPGCTPPNTCYKYTGNQPFYGIMWIFGNADMQGTPNFHGSMYIQNGTLSAQLNGNNQVNYDETIVNDVLTNVGGGLPQLPAIASWQEVDCHASPFGCN